MSAFLGLNRADFIKGLVVAVLAALLGAVQQGLAAHGVDFGAYDWAMIVNVSLTAAAAYLTKNLFSTQDGAFAGMKSTR